IEEQLKNLENELKGKREQAQKIRETIQKSERVISDLQNEINVLDGNIKQNLQQIQVLDINQYKDSEKQYLEIFPKKSLLPFSKLNRIIRHIRNNYWISELNMRKLRAHI